MAALPGSLEGSTPPSGAGHCPFAVEAFAIDTDSSVIVVHGEVDMATKPELTGIMSELVEKGSKSLVLDLANVSFMDCSGIGVIASTRARQPEGSSLVLRHPQPFIRTVLTLTGMDVVCQVED